MYLSKYVMEAGLTLRAGQFCTYFDCNCSCAMQDIIDQWKGDRWSREGVG